MDVQNLVGGAGGNVSAGTALPVWGANAFDFQELWSAAISTAFGWTGGSQVYASQFILGNTPNAGGFSVVIYGGIGRFTATANPAFFIGLCGPPLGAITGVGHIYTGLLGNCNGIIVDTAGGGAIGNWKTCSQNGVAAPVLADFPTPLAPAAGQFFAVQMTCPANSNVITLNVKQLSALGTWATLVNGVTLSATPTGTRLGVALMGSNNTAGGANNGVFLHHIYGVVDSYAVPRAF